MSQENGPLLPTPRARSEGLSAIQEVAKVLTERFYAGFTPAAQEVDVVNRSLDYVSVEDVIEELQHQDASKACGMDVIHIRLMLASCTKTSSEVRARVTIT